MVFQMESEPIYDIFDGESVAEMFTVSFANEKQSRVNLLLEAVRLCYASSARMISSEEMESASAVSERTLTATLRYWIQKNVLRRVLYKPAIYRLLDPVPLDKNNMLRYNPFAQQIADEFRDYREPLPYEIQMLYAWKTWPGLPETVILEVVHQALAQDANAGVKAMESMLPMISGASTREDTVTALAEHVQLYTDCREVLYRLGQEREPADQEVEMYAGWRRDWGFTHEAILEACSAAARGEPDFDYLNGVLRNIYQQSRATQLDAEVVKASFRVTEEYREIRRLVGGRASAESLAEYRMLREKYDQKLITLAARESGKAGDGFDGITKRLVDWEKQVLTSIKEVESYLEERREPYNLMSELFAQWGIERKPTERDLRFARQWLYAGFSRELILTAAEYAFSAEDPLLYTSKVLRRFQEKGIQTPAQRRG